MAQADNCPTRTLTFAPHAKLALSRGTCFKAPMPTGPVQLVIQRLGAQGDGIAEHEGQQVFVPLTLPGETVMAELDGDRPRLVEIVNAAPDRAPPKCSHYGECGGCALQHLSDEAYADFKRDHLAMHLSYAGIKAEIEPTLIAPPHSRRRAVFAAHRTGGDIAIGFHGRRSHRIVPISNCAVIRPALQALLPGLREIAALAAPPRDALQLSATETLTGIDLAINGASPKLPGDIRALLIQTANNLNLARLSINGEIATERTPPILRMGDIGVVPPPGGFLQATAESEAAMVKIVLDAVTGAERAVDLFCGAGTFTLPLAAHTSVHAVEGEVSGLQALGRAIRKVEGIKPITTEKRDLFKQPLTQIDLSRFDAAVIDPPRAGAEAQTRELALSGIKRVAMVSCNAQTFARDLKILLDAGFRLDRLAPIDQFLWSPHVEIVASLKR
jgi:23S rRNA (uracil1939-C5)-methyltransferase